MISKILNKIKLGKKGALGVAIGVAVLEFGTQGIQRVAPQVSSIFSRTVTTNAPFLGHISVRDLIVLSPAIMAGVKGLTGKRKSSKALINAGAGFATKWGLRRSGLNPTLFKQNVGYMKGATTSHMRRYR